METKQTITAQMLGWIQLKNTQGIFPRYKDINNKYKKISGGSNSFSHHLPNWRNENTQRPCRRYLIKAWHTGEKPGYKVQYRKVHPRLEGLTKLRSRLNNWLYTNRKNGLHEHETFYTVQAKLKDVQAIISDCTNYPTYKITKDNLMLFNNLYNTYNISKANER